ncbi:MAG: cell division protein FtsI (penicillin-binding protein 3), partial [Cellvibrionaceae bacterium]
LALQGDAIRDLFFRVGLGRDTGTGFPGESSGLLPHHARWQPIVQANFSFGYGLSLTAVQLAQAYSVIANNGIKRPVSLLRVDRRPDTEKVIDAAVAKQVKNMMRSVVEAAGTGTRAAIDAYSVAGKTGTTHKVGRDGYADDRYISLFAGFAPVDDPKVVAVVVIHEPSRGQYFGGEVAAPVFANLVERSLRLLQVLPRSREQIDAEQRFSANPTGDPIT